MTPDKLKTIIAQKEGTEIEFKKSQDSLARSVYESICAFLNRRGGHVVLGADNDGNIRRTVTKHIKNLREQGVIKRVGPDKGGHWEVIKE